MPKLYLLFLLFLNSFIAYAQEKAYFIPYQNFIFCVNTIEDGIFVVTSIHVLDKNSSDTLQAIEVENNMIFYYENAIKDAFILEDENFDGYTDIRIVKKEYANGEKDFYHWLYSPITHRFIANKDLENLTEPIFDAKTKIITSYSYSNNHSQETHYQFINEELMLIKQIDIEQYENYKEEKIKELINGKWWVTCRIKN